MKYNCYGRVVGTKYLGEVEANSEDEAIEKAQMLDSTFVSICHHCSDQIDDPEISDVTVEPA